jgi:hypothetical protein
VQSTQDVTLARQLSLHFDPCATRFRWIPTTNQNVNDSIMCTEQPSCDSPSRYKSCPQGPSGWPTMIIVATYGRANKGVSNIPDSAKQTAVDLQVASFGPERPLNSGNWEHMLRIHDVLIATAGMVSNVVTSPGAAALPDVALLVRPHQLYGCRMHLLGILLLATDQ